MAPAAADSAVRSFLAFDYGTGAWRPQPLAVPPGFQRAISAAGSVWAVASSPAAGLEVFKLLATE